MAFMRCISSASGRRSCVIFYAFRGGKAGLWVEGFGYRAHHSLRREQKTARSALRPLKGHPSTLNPKWVVL